MPFSNILYIYFTKYLHTNIIICGDFNINLHTHNITNDYSYCVDTIYLMGLVSLITISSNFIKFSNSLIDNMLINHRLITMIYYYMTSLITYQYLYYLIILIKLVIHIVIL